MLKNLKLPFNSTANIFHAKKASVKPLCLTHSDRGDPRQAYCEQGYANHIDLSSTPNLTGETTDWYSHHVFHHYPASSEATGFPSLPMLPPDSYPYSHASHVVPCNLFLLQSLELHTVPPTVHNTEMWY